jgi:hypothetical protein
MSDLKDDETYIPETLTGMLLFGSIVIIANIVLFPVMIYDKIKQKLNPSPQPFLEGKVKARKAHAR